MSPLCSVAELRRCRAFKSISMKSSISSQIVPREAFLSTVNQPAASSPGTHNHQLNPPPICARSAARPHLQPPSSLCSPSSTPSSRFLTLHCAPCLSASKWPSPHPWPCLPFTNHRNRCRPLSIPTLSSMKTASPSRRGWQPHRTSSAAHISSSYFF